MTSISTTTFRTLLQGLFASLLLTACYVYAPPPAAPSVYDRAFNAVEGAMGDQGVRITGSNPSTGTVTGMRGGITVTGTVTPRPDGTTQVAFRATGNTDEDPNLINRITAAYNARMQR